MRIIILLFISILCFGCSSLHWIAEYVEQQQIQSAVSDDAQKFAELNFCWGGFIASSAQWDKSVVITNLSVKSNGLSYSWVTGGCELLGASDRSDASQTLACLFCLIDGEWRGGKFDWISTHRVTRDFHNIDTAYHGWEPDAIARAEAYRFVIISKNGKSRSNVIEVSK